MSKLKIQMTKSELENIRDQNSENYREGESCSFYMNEIESYKEGFDCASELLMKEIESLQNINENWERSFNDSEARFQEKHNDFQVTFLKLNELQQEIESLQAKLKGACDALEFYANKSSYTQISPDFGYSIVKLNADDYIEGWNDKIGYTTKTGGKRAREALLEIRKKDEK